ncbi:hypothetical protein [Nocardioides terrisoli]|uniref:hypothetical protein n=1 Tax=Nocardioides terrisoli TaxID=3388267 RepID=UPI00287BA651|nr:hypothetical protein [Nocardioides marmorisolisilvae]
MAKAILGYSVGSDPRNTMRLASENRHLRERVADLEAVLVRLQAENEALSALASDAPADVLEPA